MASGRPELKKTKQETASPEYAAGVRNVSSGSGLNLTPKAPYLKYKKHPKIQLNSTGLTAYISDFKKGVPLQISDIQNFIVFMQTGNQFYKPGWCNITFTHKVRMTMVWIAEGLSSQDYKQNRECFWALNCFEHKLEFAPSSLNNGNIAEAIASVPLWPQRKAELIQQYGSLDQLLKKDKLYKLNIAPLFPIVTQDATDKCRSTELPTGDKYRPTGLPSGDKCRPTELPSGDKFSRTQLLLTPQQMVEERYPFLPEGSNYGNKYIHFVKTKNEYQKVTPSSPMFAVDCEMCETGWKRREVTKISIVNEKMNVIFDSYVKPYNEIQNYVTEFSGITKEILDPVTVRLKDVQRKIQELIPPDAILVGQSLCCDLKSLQMMHPYIIDTSVIFNMSGSRRTKTKLATLSAHYLGEDIQQNPSGHCTIEDSIACMKLVQLKLTESFEFGNVILSTSSPSPNLPTYSNNNPSGAISKFNSWQHQDFNHLTVNLLGLIANKQRRVAVIGRNAILQRYDCDILPKTSIECVKRESPKDIMIQVQKLVDKNEFVLCHLKYNPSQYEILNYWINRINHHIPKFGMFVVIFSNKDSPDNGACFINVKH